MDAGWVFEVLAAIGAAEARQKAIASGQDGARKKPGESFSLLLSRQQPADNATQPSENSSLASPWLELADCRGLYQMSLKSQPKAMPLIVQVHDMVEALKQCLFEFIVMSTSQGAYVFCLILVEFSSRTQSLKGLTQQIIMRTSVEHYCTGIWGNPQSKTTSLIQYPNIELSKWLTGCNDFKSRAALDI
ncbi:uncharacterized protein CLUP02_05610 [Colletotrichum lupini]|uniref:Uncharacterized protein n=1 Tax=Colletotrichum lupini TaxID=145971 RepID=A0A9Q8SMU0_9PEZI|nr:uncharacterized protein CLUP02_05610 [Colletotrichum lupini]UQC80128.1 hypothetical protein CLUP02_05610 [Colletotrichum lupini]